MGIHTTIDPFDADEIDADAATIADEMLARVLSDYARERVREANKTNREIAGEWIPYSVEIDGKTVYHGRGEVFPEGQITAFEPRAKSRREQQRAANVEFGRKVKQIIVDWAWRKIEAKALEAMIRQAFRLFNKWTAKTENLERVFFMFYGSTEDSIIEFLLSRVQSRSTLRILRTLLGSARVLRYMVRGRHLIQHGGDQDDETAVLRWIAAELRARSPVLSGDYRDGHLLFGDGVELMSAAEVEGGAVIPAARIYTFANDRPYSRKIEIGKTREGRDFVVQVPNRIYERVAAEAAGEFPGFDISFSFEDGGAVAKIGSMPVITIRASI